MNIKIAKKIVFGCMLVGMTCFLNATEVAQNMPPLEKSFVKIVNKALDEYIATTNEVKKTKIKSDLTKSSSYLLKDRMAKDWVGEVVGISSRDLDGSAIISVSLSSKPGKHVGLSAFDDDEGNIHTGIDIGSDLYNVVSELEMGDKVVFSGHFVSWPDSLLVNVVKLDSSFLGLGIFQFTSIKKIESVKKSK